MSHKENTITDNTLPHTITGIFLIIKDNTQNHRVTVKKLSHIIADIKIFHKMTDNKLFKRTH